MRERDFYNFLIEALNGSAVVTLSPGPFEVKVCDDDMHAANLIMRIGSEIGEDATYKQAEDWLLTGMLNRLDAIVEGNTEGGKVESAALWADDRVRALLAAWWWLTFFRTQANGNASWRAWKEWAKWPFERLGEEMRKLKKAAAEAEE